jgi:formylmethanofuran dehydrogenase subunit E-like metal-binding protein
MTVFISIIMSLPCFAGDIHSKDQALSSYETWKTIGSLAAGTWPELMKITDMASVKEKLIVLTNAGYAEINGASTQGALDGLSDITGASRGNNTLLNATPGKKSYAVSYPNEEDKQKRVAEAKNASTIVYRQNKNKERWAGIVLAFEMANSFPPSSCSGYGKSLPQNDRPVMNSKL